MTGSSPLTRLLAPNSLAVFGGRQGEAVIAAARHIGYTGDIWPVHPNRREMSGLECYRQVSDLPAPPDAGFVAVNREKTVEIVSELARIGAGGAVCYASGFEESGDDGRRLQADLVGAAADMPLIGPNCYGFVNFLDRAALWPDQQGGKTTERGVAILCQSSNIAVNLSMNRRGLPIGFLGTLGNQAVTGLSDLIRHFSADPRITAIGVHIEGIDDAASLREAAWTAHLNNTPLVVLKTGNSEIGARIADTHTAAMAGSADVMAALFRKLGMVQVDTITRFLETLKFLHVLGRPKGRRLVSLSCSGGEAALVGDLAKSASVDLAPFSAERSEAIAATVNSLVHVGNPFDYHTFDWADRPRMRATFREVLKAHADLTALILDMPRSDRCEGASWDVGLEAFVDAVGDEGGPAAVVASLPEGMPEHLAERLIELEIVPFSTIEDALGAMSATAGCVPEYEPGPTPARPVRPSAPLRGINEHDGKRRLIGAGIAVPAGRLCRDRTEIAEACSQLGYPLVAKLVADEITHKTELGAVRIGLATSTEVTAAADDLFDLGEEILLERMITDGLAELLIGIRQDPVVGPIVMLGVGGQLCELIGGGRILVPPINQREIAEALSQLPIAPLLSGYRGAQRTDLAALAGIIHQLAVWALGCPELEDFEINPLIVRPGTLPPVAADCVMTLRILEEADDRRA